MSSLQTAPCRYPWHASCSVDWQFGEPCPAVRDKILQQIAAWQVVFFSCHLKISTTGIVYHCFLLKFLFTVQGDGLCPGTSPACPRLPCGQNCLYELTSSGPGEIRGTHTTPVARSPPPRTMVTLYTLYTVLRYVDDISFQLSPASSGCAVSARSRSQLW